MSAVLFLDVTEGQELPPFQRTTDLMNWNRFAAVNDGFFYMHMDDEVARASGYPAAFGMGNLQLTYLHNLLREWVCETGWIKRIRCQFRGLNFKNDVLTARGTVVKKYVRGGENLIDIELWIENQDSRRICSGTATLVLFS